MRGLGFRLNNRTIIQFYNVSKSYVVIVFNLLKDYIASVIGDGGVVNNDQEVKDYWTMAAQNDMLDSIEFAWISGAGIKTRESGIYDYATTLYSLDETPNNATQTTESLQPFTSGNIAPNELPSLKNPNGGTRYMTHPEIAFGATDEWSVTTVVNWDHP